MTGYLKFLCLLLLSTFLETNCFGQEPEKDPGYLDISAVVNLDSFTVVASKTGFSVTEFIQLVREDESFINAFHNLRFLNYTSTNTFDFKSKRNKSIASNSAIIRQTMEDSKCRKTRIIKEDPQGKFYKNQHKKEYKYYTSKMHDRLFYAHNRSCTALEPTITPTGESRLEKYVSELKKLIFKPGEKANVPFIGDKLAIFENSMSKYYDYSVESVMYEDKVDCYVFTAKVKDKYMAYKTGKTVIKYLKTYFRKADFQVMGRNYQLKYNAALYEFDLTMVIKLGIVENKYVPILIQYDGFWDLPFYKKESSKFTLTFYDFKPFE